MAGSRLIPGPVAGTRRQPGRIARRENETLKRAAKRLARRELVAASITIGVPAARGRARPVRPEALGDLVDYERAHTPAAPAA
jgi:hypothetical protein